MLDLVVDAEGGLTVAEVARATGAHANTAREHLDALVHSGDLARAQLPAVGRGRPPMIYRALPNAREVGPEYRVLAEALVRRLAEEWPEKADQRSVGLQAGAALAATRGDGDRSRLLCAALFDAEVVPGTVPTRDDDGMEMLTVRLRRCPVLDVARAFPEIVCSIHLGLIRGWLGDDDEAQHVQLQPFGDVGACLLRLPESVASRMPSVVEALVAGDGACDALVAAVREQDLGADGGDEAVDAGAGPGTAIADDGELVGAGGR